MTELNKTRKIFVFMFFSMTILPVTPVTTTIIFMYTFDEPKIDRVDLKSNIQESNLLTKVEEPNDSMENLPPSEKEKELQLLLNSQGYKNTVNRIDELSQNELNLISDDLKNNLYKKEIRLVTFILSIIWIILGIRQYIILSSWKKI